MRFNAIAQTCSLLLKPFVPGLGPGIHEQSDGYRDVSWMAGPRPAMNEK
jgi:hypothetical protein